MTIWEMTEVYNIQNETRLSAVEFLNAMFAGHTELLDKRIDLEQLCYNIVRRAGNLDAYDVTGPSMFSVYVGIWCKNNQYYIQKTLDSTEFDYVPIHNYDRHEEGHRDNTQTRNLTQPFNENTENSTSAYNSNSFKPVDKAIRGGSTGDQGTVGDDENYKNYMYGNIGVTSTQELIEAERKVVDYSAVESIAQRFVDDNFVKVW